MKKRGGSLDNQMLYYTVAVIGALNLIAYVSVGDWRSMGWFVVSGICMFVLTANKSIAILVAILAGALCRSVYVEGMTKKKKLEPKSEPEPKMGELNLKDIMNGSNLEGLTQKATKLAEKQKEMVGMATQLGPLMEQANKMMDKLPEGFLEQAMKRIK